MAFKVKKIGVLIPKNSSGAKRVFRYEVPLLKRIWSNSLGPDDKIEIKPIPDHLGEIRYGFVTSAEDEFQRLSVVYATHGKHNTPLFERVYTSFQDFKLDFDIAMERDAVEDDVEVPDLETSRTQHPPEADAISGHSELETIKGVGSDLAIKLIKAGMTRVKQVALAEIEDLEAIDGIGLSTAATIKSEALKRMNFGASSTGELV